MRAGSSEINISPAFDATGVRLREIPLNPERVLSALRGESAPAVRA